MHLVSFANATLSGLLFGLKINHPLPDDLQRRYNELLERRDARSLMPAEYQELLQLTDQVELMEHILPLEIAYRYGTGSGSDLSFLRGAHLTSLTGRYRSLYRTAE